ncbi:MAG: hypothetical protein JJU15_07865 [Pararhodobacter sp.]|nr:hypothetical protein [Pararhodobacter sp.]
MIIKPLFFRAFRAAWLGVVGVVFLLVVALTPARAGDVAVPGADAAAFSEALALWLADDEGAALPALAALAQDNNRAAQILLGLIDKSPPLQGPWLAHLPRNERIALMRAPGGMSGQSWLNVASGEPLAAVWLALFSVDAGLDVVTRFIDLGETRAAREALLALAAREHPDLRQAPPEALDAELLYLPWRTADDARRAALMAHVPADHPQRMMMGEPPDDAALMRWLEQAPAALPVVALCDARCPDSRAACMSGAYQALSSHNALLTLGSPAEALVSQVDFLQSPRGQAAVLRRILQSADARGRAAMITQMRAQDECLADVLYEERARYYYRRPGTDNGATEAPPTQD